MKKQQQFSEEDNIRINRGSLSQEDGSTVSLESEQRKQRSIEILEEMDIPYIKHLPRIESSSEITPRTPQEIARRAIACLMAIQVACDINSDSDLEASRNTFTGLLRKYEVENDLTEKEKVILYGNPSKKEAADMSWKYEAYWVLVWALGLVEELEYPSDICDCMHAIEIVRSCDSLEEFLQRAVPRSMEKILDEADLIYRYNWACVNARLHNEEAPEYLDAGIVFERHWALNWLIGKNTHNNDWDSVSTDT